MPVFSSVYELLLLISFWYVNCTSFSPLWNLPTVIYILKNTVVLHFMFQHELSDLFGSFLTELQLVCPVTSFTGEAAFWLHGSTHIVELHFFFYVYKAFWIASLHVTWWCVMVSKDRTHDRTFFTKKNKDAFDLQRGAEFIPTFSALLIVRIYFIQSICSKRLWATMK